MLKKEKDLLARIEQNFFKSPENFIEKMTEKEHEIMLRYQAAFFFWNEHPDYPDTKLVNFLMDTHGVQRSQAWRDVDIVRKLLGNMKKCSKEWERYRVTQLAYQGHSEAMSKEQYTSAAIFLDKVIKANKLDQQDLDDIDWADIKNPDFDVSSDVRVLDPRLFQEDIDKKRKMLREKYKSGTIEEVPFTPVNNAE
jgi:hypothetical protein